MFRVKNYSLPVIALLVSLLSACTGAGDSSSNNSPASDPNTGFDVIAPSKPENLRTTRISPTSIEISWDASTDDIALVGYHVYRNNVQIADTTETTYTDNSVTASSNYDYAIVAYDTSDNLTTSTMLHVSTPQNIDTSAPSAPGNLRTTAINSTSISLAWNSSADNVGVTGYRVYRGTTLITTTTSLAYTNTGLSAGTAYQFHVDAIDAAANSASSSTLNVSTIVAADISAPTAPGNLHSTNTTDTSIALAWNAATDNVGVTGYRIYRGTTLVTTTTSLAYTNSNLSPSTTYQFHVDAFDAVGNSKSSSTLTVNTIAAADTSAPTAPGNLRSTNTTDTSISLAWNASTDNVGVTGYRVYRGTTLVTTTASLAYTNSGLSAGTTYQFHVDAIDAAGNNTSSSTLVVNTVAANDTSAPTAPSNLHTTSITSSSIALAWNASTDNVGVTGYKVYRGTSLLTTTTSLSYTSSGLTADTSYQFHVDAVDAAGNATSSSTLTASTTSAPVFSTQGCGTTASAPCVLYTDALSGPISGGENNKGAYLSIYGRNFGSISDLGSNTKVYIGNQEVDNYRVLQPSVVYSKFGVDMLTVQIGAIGNPTLGTALPVKVCIHATSTPVCSNENNTFTPNNGRILFVALNGNDGTASFGDITRPWRYMQTSSRGGAYASMRAGDHVIIRGGDWSDIAFETAWLRFRDTTANGAAGNWIHFTAYPGEQVTYTTPANAKGGFQGAASAYADTTGKYISISNLIMRVDENATTDAAPFNEQSGIGPWRVVNNEIGPWLSLKDARAGGYSGGGSSTNIFGNYIHDIRRICDSTNSGTSEFNSKCSGSVGGGESLLNHGMYIDGGANGTEIAYNYISNVLEGNLIQTYDSVGMDGILNISIHNNWCENAGKHGLNISDGTGGNLTIYNNVVIGAKYAGIRLNIGYTSVSGAIAHNTLFGNDSQGTSAGQLTTTWNPSVTGSLRVTNNLIHTNNKTNTTFYLNDGSSDAYLSWGTNLYYNGTSSSVTKGVVIVSNPLLNNPTADDFSLQSGSPAIDAAVSISGLNVTDDLYNNPRSVGTAADMGALEYAP